MNEILKGIKVIECGTWIVAPAVASNLGELGADVIKIESPTGGDPCRNTHLYSLGRTAETIATGRDYLFEATNRNKRSLALDITKREGKEIVYKLVRDADVFLHNFRVGVAERLGLDYESLLKHNPRLIYAHGTGWGLKGPESTRPALEFCGFERSGWGYLGGAPDEPPILFAAGPGDWQNAMVLTTAILAALLGRERLNISQSVESSLLGSLIFSASLPFTHKLTYGQEYPRRNRLKSANPLWNHYKCADNKWIALAMIWSSKYWQDFCSALGTPELADDPKYDSVDNRYYHCEELIGVLDSIFITKTAAEWAGRFKKKNLAFEVAQTVSDAINDPQVLANDYIVDFDDPRYGRIKIVGPPYKFSKTPVVKRNIAPELGQHTDEVLFEHGYNQEEIASFREQGLTSATR